MPTSALCKEGSNIAGFAEGMAHVRETVKEMLNKQSLPKNYNLQL